MENACGLVDKLRDLVIDTIWEQLSYLRFYHSNIGELDKQLVHLTDERTYVQHQIDAAMNNGEKIEDKVERWLRSVDVMVEQTQNFHEEENQARIGCTRTSCPNLWLRYKLSKRAKEMALDVVDILKKRNFERVSYRDPPRWIMDSINDKSNEGFESRTLIMNDIMDALQDPTVNLIGLCGLGGVGKTTIAKEIAKKVKDEKMFEKVIMANVSQYLNLEKIQEQIAEMLGMKLDERIERIRSRRLFDRLKQEKNVLLILDDLWEKLDLNEVGIPFTNDRKNKDGSECCTILLTSRNNRLLSDEMNCRRVIKVGVLFDKEACELFKGIADLSDDLNILSIADEIVQLCAGLPVRIVAAAGALRNKNSNEWKDALQRLKNPLRRNITRIEEADSIFWLSYDKLNEELQHIFLLCAMLSYDPLIINLFMYSVGLGLFQGIQNMEEAQHGLAALISKLKASNLLLESDSDDCFAMHDVVHDVALSIASMERHVLVVRHVRQYECPDRNLLEGYSGICLDQSDFIDLPKELYGPKVKFFLLHSKNLDLQIPSTFFKSMHELQVVGLTSMHFSSLPSSLNLLEKLRTLCLHSCVLEDISEVGKLKSLKVLSLASSLIERLPYELGGLTCLQMLNLANCTKLEEIPPNVLSKLQRLEILCMENSFNRWEAKGSSQCAENASLEELKHLSNLSSLDIHIPDASILPKDLFLQNCLERYKIFIGEGWEWSGRYETSKTLKLQLKSSIHLEHGVQKLLEQVEDLYLREVCGITDVLNDLNGKEFPHLKHLWIEGNDQIEYVINNSMKLVGAFPNLETLNLGYLNGLKKLCRRRITSSFQHLRVFRLWNCEHVKNVFSISIVECLCQLVEIEIDECTSVEGIVVTSNQDASEQNLTSSVIVFHQLCSLTLSRLPSLTSFYFEEENATNKDSNAVSKSVFNNKVSFPKLEKLKLDSLNRSISSMWDDQLPHSFFSKLKTLIVKNCGISGKLIPFHVLKSLNNLEELVVYSCDMLEMVFDFEELNDYKETHSLVVVPLKILKLWSMPKLKHVWSNEPQGIVSFRSLRQVDVYVCESLKSMFPASVAKDLPHLEDLQIELCGIDVIVAKDQVLESVATTFVFPKLTSLQLQRLPNLRNFYPYRHTSEWPHLQHLNISYCDELEIFEKQVSSPSSIEKEEALDSKYPLFCHDEVLQVIPNLKVLSLGGKQGLMAWNDQFPVYHFHKVKQLHLNLGHLPNSAATFPFGLLKRFPNLEELSLRGWIQEIFSCNDSLRDDGSLVLFPKLSLAHLKEAKHIWNEHSPLYILQGLESLRVCHCIDLISLGPTFIFLANLTDLHVEGCHGLTTLLTLSTAGSLVHLTKLTICDCHQIEEIITKQAVDEERDINFNKLGHLELSSLPRLKSFCSHNYSFRFPLLDQVIINGCPRLRIFCTGVIYAPSLKSVEIEQDKKIWKANLNNTIQQRFTLSEVISTLGELQLNQMDAFMMRNDQFPVGLYPKVIILYVDNFIDEWVTFPYSFLERFPMLNVLCVEHCSFEEIFPSQAQIVDHVGKISPFRELFLASLDELKYIWKDDPQLQPIHQNLRSLEVESCSSLIKLAPSSASFENLGFLKISSCHQLSFLVTNSTAKSLVNLYEFEIMDCKKMEEIIRNETIDDGEGGITFNGLRWLTLVDLPSLKSFCSESHPFKFPELREITTNGCLQMKMFCLGALETPKLSKVKIEGNDMHWKDEGDLNKAIEQLSMAKDGMDI